jgi:phosphodiesterase/alkaline phosphatase D-like protein
MLNAAGASAETYSVKTTAELTAAVAKANANTETNKIVLEGGSYTPVKSLVLKNTSGALTIEGPTGSPSIKGKAASIDGTSVEPTFAQLFVIEGGVSVTLRNLEIGGAGGLGTPAIEVTPKGSLTIESSTLEGNIGSGVLVDDEGALAVRNSTISEDSEFGVLNNGTASFFNATVAFNEDGGLQNAGTLNLTNTIVAENAGGGDCVGAATTSDHSLDSDGSCGVGALSNKNPLLQQSLLNDGGTTPLHPLKPDSPAIGAGDEAQCPKTDQRGAKRADPCSIGADEYNSTPPTITVPAEIVAEAESEAGAAVSYSASAAGFENAIRTFGCVPESGSTFPIGTTVVKCTAVDGHENTATKSFNVKVTPKGVAPVAPTVVTGAASAVAQSSATLNATVNPNGSEVTECAFEYGTSTSYGKTASCASLPGSGTSAVAVSAPISGLSASTVYHFRIVAKNAGGTSQGSDETLKTLAAPVAPTVVTGAASAVAQSSATLNATVNPNGSEVTECRFEYGTSTSYGKTASCSSLPGSGTSAVAVSASVSGLSASTVYHFRIVAKNAGGTSQGLDATFTTAEETKVAPVAPTVVTGAASAVAQSSATLNATVNPNGSEVTECTFEYGTSTSYGGTASCSSLPGSGTSAVAVSASVSGLSAGTVYHFRIVAKNAGGTSQGLDATFTTAEETKVAPKVEPKVEPKAEPKVEPPPSVEPAPDVTLTVNSITVSSKGGFVLKLSCPGEDKSCSGTVTVRTLTAVLASRGYEAKSKKPKAAILTLASGSFTLSGGQVEALTLRLSSKARALLSRTKVLRVRVTVVAQDAAGATHTTQETVTLRAARAR